ncbi:hypothetical protein PEC301879_34000 [Pectobacterium carotovorum subsp. carotovorum]|nr:hypothetical protein PEC301879_34000 [Pectobacterium carotovorum subsp. carotovorum]
MKKAAKDLAAFVIHISMELVSTVTIASPIYLTSIDIGDTIPEQVSPTQSLPE